MAGGDKITVLNPMGYPPAVTHKPLAPRLETLDGKTVYLVDCRFDDADIFLKQVQAWFAEHMPVSKRYSSRSPASIRETTRPPGRRLRLRATPPLLGSAIEAPVRRRSPCTG